MTIWLVRIVGKATCAGRAATGIKARRTNDRKFNVASLEIKFRRFLLKRADSSERQRYQRGVTAVSVTGGPKNLSFLRNIAAEFGVYSKMQRKYLFPNPN